MVKDGKIFDITKQIIKWIWRIIILLFFALFIYLQAPLKVLIVIAIFVLESIFLPLRWRKWFWAGVGIVVLVLVLWVFVPENDEGWRPFTFDDELAALEAKNKIPDKENAAVIYEKLIADYNKSDFEPNFITCEMDNALLSEYWSAKDYPQVAKWINSNKLTINQLTQASKFEKCKFDVTAKSWLLQDIDRLGAFRRWVQLLSRAGNNDIAEGRTDEGLKKYYCVLQMGKHLCRQSFLIDALTGIALKPLAISCLDKYVIVGNPNKKQLDAIEKMINEVKYDWQSDLPRVLDYEKLLMKNLCGIFYEANSKGRFRFARNPSKAIRALTPTEFNEIPSLNYFQRKLVKASSIIYWFFVPSTPQKLSKDFDSAYQRYYEMADPNFDWSKKPTEFPISSFVFNYKLNYKHFLKILARMEESTYFKIHSLYLREDSSKRGALLLIAARRYKVKNGVWPENLAEIADLTEEENFIDPVNGQSFVYKLTGDSFILYSKGENGIDDNGDRYSEYSSDANRIKKTADDIKIWPLKPCKKKLPKVISEEPNETQSN